VRKVRWEPAAGEIRHVFDDELVPATMGIRAELLRQIEPFPTGDLIPYDPGYVSGWVVEQYQIDLVLAADHARQQMDEEVRELCAAEIPGDTHRNLVTFPEYTDRTFKHVLAPVWVLGYTYGPRTFQVLINGYTGAIAGEHPLSWVKIAFAVFVALLAVLALLYFNQ
jgi:hypothetical protein